ncbi:integrase core domain-containing protein [Xanthobacter versatilis]|uniref:integrase core domain-containing protein n=1 Tax=Xanthobacter autotrophicus (strain ATCC BAA-1158 / Py2) TaxID=78245 RepID=UPI00372D60E8
MDRLRDDWKVSARRACATLAVDRALYAYKSKRGTQAELNQRIKEICETRVRYGYDEARAKMEAWRRDYNEVRPHSAIGNKPPIALMNGSPASPPA